MRWEAVRNLAGADARLRALGRAGDAEAAGARAQRARLQRHLRAGSSPACFKA